MVNDSSIVFYLSVIFILLCTHLFVSTLCVPQRIPQHLSRSSFRMHGLDLYSRFGDRSERSRLPVRLSAFFPHDGVELVIVLVTEHEAHVVVINVGVHEKRAFEVYTAKRIVT